MSKLDKKKRRMSSRPTVGRNEFLTRFQPSNFHQFHFEPTSIVNHSSASSLYEIAESNQPVITGFLRIQPASIHTYSVPNSDEPHQFHSSKLVKLGSNMTDLHCPHIYPNSLRHPYNPAPIGDFRATFSPPTSGMRQHSC